MADPQKVNELKLGPTERESDKITALRELQNRLNDIIRQFNLLLDAETDETPGSGGGTAGVTSFNSRIGVVAPAAGDYTVGMVTNAVATTDVRLSNPRTPLPHTHPQTDVVGLAATFATKEATANKGVAGGYAGLDGGGLVPFANLGTGIATGVKFLRDDRTWAVPSGGGGGGSGVDDWNGRIGSVVPVTGDYTVAQVTGAVATTDSRLSDARTPVAHTHPQADVTGLVAALAAKEATANKGVAGGYASLDGTGKVPVAQLPGASLPLWVTNHPDTPPASPVLFSGVSYDKEFASLGAHGGTVVGSPANAPVIVDGALKIFSGTSGSADTKGVEWPCPAGAFTLTGKFRRKISGSTYGAFGPILRVGSSGDTAFTACWSALNSGLTGLNIEIDDYNAQANRGAAGFGNNLNEALLLPYYMKLFYDGTNLTYSFSFTGQPDSFLAWAVRASGAYGRFGFYIDNFGGTQNVGYCEWIRFS
jgi:hypothetical protein